MYPSQIPPSPATLPAFNPHAPFSARVRAQAELLELLQENREVRAAMLRLKRLSWFVMACAVVAVYVARIEVASARAEAHTCSNR